MYNQNNVPSIIENGALNESGKLTTDAIVHLILKYKEGELNARKS